MPAAVAVIVLLWIVCCPLLALYALIRWFRGPVFPTPDPSTIEAEMKRRWRRFLDEIPETSRT